MYDTTRSTPDPLKSALQRFKYDRDVSLAPVLADLMAAHAPLLADDYDVVIPVPLHNQRLRWRGFNQALLLARPLVGRVRVDRFTLRRQRATASQVGLSEADRQRNVRAHLPDHCPGYHPCWFDAAPRGDPRATAEWLARRGWRIKGSQGNWQFSRVLRDRKRPDSS